MNVLPCGDRAILVECADGDEARRFFAAVAADADSTLGARTVLLRGDPRELRALVSRAVLPNHLDHARARTITIPVTYDGTDLADVAALTGLTPDAVVDAHTESEWTVGFAGFAPGFAYLTGGDPRLHVPRRDAPRAVVPAGSVALAGLYSGVYPRESPGGWQLIGRTESPLWDLDRDPPALLQPGDTVRFEAIG